MTMNENENKNINCNVRCKRGFYKRKFIKKKMKEKRKKLFKMAIKLRTVSSNENKIKLFTLDYICIQVYACKYNIITLYKLIM